MKAKITRTIALALAALTVASFAACGKKPATTEPETAETQAIESTAAEIIETPTEEDVETTASENVDTQTTAAEEGTEAEVPDVPTDKAEILKIYNDATAKVVDQKVTFTHTRETKEGVYNAGVALKTFKSIVYQFMGIGAENVYNKEVTKADNNYGRHIQKSTLTVADINDATCTKNDDGSMTIVIKVKGGSSSIEGGKNEKINAPLDKSAVSSGRDDKSEWDHKTAQNVYDAIADVAGGAVISESYSNAVIKATVDKNGNLTSMESSFDIVFDISKVYGSSGHATCTTYAKLKDFKW